MSITAKFNLLVCFAILSTLGIVFFSSFFSLSTIKVSNQEALNEIIFAERKAKLKELTDNACVVLQITRTSVDEFRAIRAINNMRFGIDNKNYFFVIDHDGKFVAYSPDPSLVGTLQIDLQTEDKTFPVREMIQRAKKHGDGYIRYLWQNPNNNGVLEEKLTYFKQVEGKPWIVGTGIYNTDIKGIVLEKEEALHDNFISIVFSSLGFVLIFSVFFFIFTLWVVGKMLSPMRKVAHFAKEVGGGNLTATLDYSSNDEIGVMAQAMQQAVKDLADLIQKMVDTSHTVAQSSFQLINVAQDLKGSSKEMESYAANADHETRRLSDYLKNIFSASQKINEQLDKIAGATDAVSNNTIIVGQTIEAVSGSTTSASCAVEQMYASFSEAAQNSSKGSAVSSKASTMAKDTGQIMDRLGNAADEIGEIIQMIQDIAAQTHLLSLNAAIEAAGAGDAGKGFFVVANEVKELANQTESSAGIIRKKIQSMQANTREAVNVIQSIAEVISQIDQIMFAIASSIEEQTAVTNDISSNLSKTAESAGDLNTRSKENIKAFTEVAQSIETTAKESDMIQQDVHVTETGIEDVIKYVGQANNSVIASAVWIDTIQSQADDLARLAKELEKAIQLFKI